MPFTSHLFMDVLGSAHPDFLFGKLNETYSNKLPLRLLGNSYGIPKEIILREKMPFNEGATGDKNGEPYELEKSAALEWMTRHGLTWDGEELNQIRKFYSLPAEVPSSKSDKVPGMTDQMALVLAAKGSGANRLFLGKIFQAQPSSPPVDNEIYSPKNLRQVYLN